jgi:hypothetical protein
MSIRYLIENLSEGGYWSTSRDCFGGLLFAHFFETEFEAQKTVNNLLTKNPKFILRIIKASGVWQ